MSVASPKSAKGEECEAKVRQERRALVYEIAQGGEWWTAHPGQAPLVRLLRAVEILILARRWRLTGHSHSQPLHATQTQGDAVLSDRCQFPQRAGLPLPARPPHGGYPRAPHSPGRRMPIAAPRPRA